MKTCQNFRCFAPAISMAKLVGSKGTARTELLTGILFCARCKPAVSNFGPHMKSFLKDKLPKKGIGIVYYTVELIPIDSDEVRAYYSGAPN